MERLADQVEEWKKQWEEGKTGRVKLDEKKDLV